MNPIPTFLICLYSIILNAQPYLGIGASNRGANFQLGMLSKQTEFTLAYKMPFSRVDVPSIVSVSVGRLLLLTKNSKDNFGVLPSLGIAHSTVHDFTNYDLHIDNNIRKVTTINPIFAIAAFKDSYLGRAYLAANYCSGFFFEIGMKMFPYR